MCKVSGHPRPRLTWWVNGSIIVNGHRFHLRFDGMINVLEIPKVREYDNGTIRVVAKNPLGEAECSTTLVVIPHEDWRSRLKQAPRCEYKKFPGEVSGRGSPSEIKFCGYSINR